MNRNDVDIFFQKIEKKCDEIAIIDQEIRDGQSSLVDEIENDADKTISDISNNLESFIINNFESIKTATFQIKQLLKKKLNEDDTFISHYEPDLGIDELKSMLKEKVTEFNGRVEKLNLIDFSSQIEEKKIVQKNPNEFDVVCKDESIRYTPLSNPVQFSEKQVLDLISDSEATDLLKNIKEIETLCDLLAEGYRKKFDLDFFVNSVNGKKDAEINKLETKIDEEINNQLQIELEKSGIDIECENLLKQIDETTAKYTPAIQPDPDMFKEMIALGNYGYEIDGYYSNKKYLDNIRGLSGRIRGGEIFLPFIINLREKGNIWINTKENNYSDVTKEFVNHIIMSLFLSFPAKNLHLYLLDVNEKIGFAPYLAFKKINESILPYGVIRDDGKLDEILNEVKRVKYDSEDKLGMEGMINIFDYNTRFASSPIDLNVIVLVDFPFGFDKTKLTKLKSIISNGKNDGVFAVIVNNDSLQADDSISLDDEAQNIIDDIKKSSYCFNVDFGSVTLLEDDIETDNIEVANPIKVSDIGKIVEAKTNISTAL